jgi:acyl carrier protein
MKYISIISAILITLAGIVNAVLANPSERSQIVYSVISKQLQIEKESFDIHSTFQEIGADALDIVEIIMTIEEHLNIVIDDEEISIAANTKDLTLIPQTLSIENFISIVDNSPYQKTKEIEEKKNNGLELYDGEVGIYKELIEKENPNNLVLIYVPDVKKIISMEAQKLERELSSQEIESLKQNSVVIAMEKENAKKFLLSRRKKK